MNNAFPHVFLQSAGYTEGHVTEPALESVVPHPPVSLHVPGELAALGAGVFTNITFVGFLSGVRSDMYGEVGSVLENFPTIFTSVVPLNILQGLDAPFPRNLPEQTGLHGRERLLADYRLPHVVLH